MIGALTMRVVRSSPVPSDRQVYTRPVNDHTILRQARPLGTIRDVVRHDDLLFRSARATSGTLTALFHPWICRPGALHGRDETL